eukprot:ctg_71.g15
MLTYGDRSTPCNHREGDRPGVGGRRGSGGHPALLGLRGRRVLSTPGPGVAASGRVRTPVRCGVRGGPHPCSRVFGAVGRVGDGAVRRAILLSLAAYARRLRHRRSRPAHRRSAVGTRHGGYDRVGVSTGAAWQGPGGAAAGYPPMRDRRRFTTLVESWRLNYKLGPGLGAGAAGSPRSRHSRQGHATSGSASGAKCGATCRRNRTSV